MSTKKSQSKTKTVTRYGSAESGRFLTDKQGQRRDTAKVVRERVPKPGRGDTK